MKKLIALLLVAGSLSAKCGSCKPSNCTEDARPVCEKQVVKTIRRPALAEKKCHTTYTCPTDCETKYQD